MYVIVQEATGGWELYTPGYQGNRRAELPMRIEVRGMTAAEWRAYKLKHAEAMQGPLSGVEERVYELLRGRLRAPQRFYVQRHGESEPREVSELGEFLAYAPDALLTELYKAVIDATRLGEGLEGN